MDITTILTWAGMYAAGLLWGYIPASSSPEGVEIQQQVIQQQAMQPQAPLPISVFIPDPVRSSNTSGTAGVGRRR